MPLFRQAAIDRLASPEELDRLLEVTAPRGWLALLGILTLLAATVVWSILGRLPTRVSGVGILVRKGGLTSLSALGSGQLVEVAVRAGDPVSKGQVVAKLALPELGAELESAQASLRGLEIQHEQLSGFSQSDVRLQGAAIAQQRVIANGQIAVAKQRRALFSRKLETQTRLLQEGLITEQTLQGTRDALIMAGADVERAVSTLRELTAKRTEIGQRKSQEAGERLLRIADLRRRIVELTERIRLQSQIRSQEAGRVVEVRTAVGQLVTPGMPILLLELGAETGQEYELEAIVYVPGTDGKKVQGGMRAEISPSTVRREEHGALRASVAAVASFPSTRQAILARLSNPDLASSFFGAIDNPIELRIDLKRTPFTASGYQWTSPAGPAQRVQPGTLCTVIVTISSRAPITFLLPLLKEKLTS